VADRWHKFDVNTPPMLEAWSEDTRVLLGEETTLNDLRPEACDHCPWCNGCICADDETAKHCFGGCDCFGETADADD
jgi:hypothetical protein